MNTAFYSREAEPTSPNDEIRQQFSILQRHPELVYLDSASTTLKPDCVLDAIADYYQHHMSNVNRGVSEWSNWVNQKWREAHDVSGELLGVSGDNITLTYSSTYAINMVAQGIKHLLQSGDVIILGDMEHNSNVLPWLAVARETGAKVIYYDTWNNSNAEQVDELINQGIVKIVSFAALPNIFADQNYAVTDMAPLAQKAQHHGALVCVDATQAIPYYDGWELYHMGVTPSPSQPGAKFSAWAPCWKSKQPNSNHHGADFIIYSGHKVYGPTGIGVLYIRPEIQPLVQPIIYGSQTFASISDHDFELLGNMARFEPGTPNIEGAICLIAGINFFQQYHCRPGDGTQLAYDLRLKLRDAGFERDLVLHNPQHGILSLSHPGIHPHDIAMFMDKHHIVVRAGKLCADLALANVSKLGTAKSRSTQEQVWHSAKNGVVRVSLGLYTNEADLDKFVAAYEEAIDELS